MSAFFRGISADQDGRFQKADEILRTKMAKAGKFAAILQTKVQWTTIYFASHIMNIHIVHIHKSLDFYLNNVCRWI